MTTSNAYKKITNPNQPIFDPDWSYTENEFRIQDAAYKESLFSIGNGYLGVRGYFDEGYPETIANTTCSAFLNGVYESVPITYDESAYGFAKNCHHIIDVPRHKFLIELDGKIFNFNQGNITEYQRSLNYKTGTLTRFFIWQTESGKRLALQYERTALFAQPNIMLARLTMTALNFSGKITVKSVLSAEYQNQQNTGDPRSGNKIPAENWLRETTCTNNDCLQYLYRAQNSSIRVVTSLQSAGTGNVTSTVEASNNYLAKTHCILFSDGKPHQVDTIVSYVDSRNYPDRRLLTLGNSLCSNAMSTGYDALIQTQIKNLTAFWQHTDIQINSTDGAQSATRFAFFHLFQSTGRNGISSIAAKGLTGSGYDGHYFWDTETYIFPFWLFNEPKIARKLLEYRVDTLGAARQHAREMGHVKGALFPWRTIGGEECSSFFPAGSAQYHINGDIAYAARSYIRITEDYDFLIKGLAETILETVRIWMDLGHFSNALHGRFGIYGVTGPDEYTAMINNNYYTNKMAQTHLNWACEVAETLQKSVPEFWKSLKEKIGLDEKEQILWKRAADNMYFAFDDQQNIYAQDDSFLEKPQWDFKNTPKNKYPLLLYFHPLVIYRYQVLKQADTLLALLLEGEKESPAIKRACYDYYEPITTHDSTLSTCIYGVMASEVGYKNQAYHYFNVTLNLDLEDKHNNTYYGVHTAAMGGVWMGIVQGFAGLRYGQGVLNFTPQLPEKWQSLAFKLQFRKSRIEITMTKKNITYRLLKGDNITINHKGVAVTLIHNQPIMLDN